MVIQEVGGPDADPANPHLKIEMWGTRLWGVGQMCAARLALGGTKDLIGRPDVNLPALRKMLVHDADVTVVMMPGLNHFFQHADTGLPSEMSSIEETLAPEVLSTIIPWLRKHTAAGAAH